MANLRDNLPSALDSIVGRQEELDWIAAWLSRGDSRILTITGAGGVGKTRLATEAAHRAGGAAGPRIMVDLSALTDANLFADALREALGLDPAPSIGSLEVIQAGIGQQAALLVLDNLEQVRDAGQDLVRLLGQCRGLRAIVTSRLPLRVLGESLLLLRPLPVPNSSESTDSTILFERRLQLGSGVRMDATQVASLCRRLDGLPLALEIAAARARYVPAEQILSEIGELALLSDSHVAGTGRFRSLAGAIDWSYRLLAPAEQAIFRRLAVFRGQFSLNDASSVCGQEAAVTVPTLAEHSLVLFESSGGDARYRMLEVIRLFAAGRATDAGEWEEASRRHVGRFTEQAAACASIDQDRAAVNAFARSLDNFRIALDYALSGGDKDSYCRLAASLSRYWRIRGPYQEGVERLAVAIDFLRGADRQAELSALLVDRGVLLCLSGDHASAAPLFEESLGYFESTAERAGQARCLNFLGTVSDVLGDLDRAEQLYVRSLRLRVELADEVGAAAVRNNLALIRWRRGDLAGAEELLAEALAFYRSKNLVHREASALSNLAEVAAARGDIDRAEALFRNCADLHRSIGDPRGEATALAGMGDVASGRNDVQHAKELYQRSAALYIQAGDARSLADLQSRAAEPVGDASSQREVATPLPEVPSLPSDSTRDIVRVKLLGEVHIEATSGGIGKWDRRAHRFVFLNLCLAGGRSQSRSALAERFWPHLDSGAAQHALRKALSDIRTFLASLGAASSLQANRDSVRLDTDATIWVDALEFLRNIEEAQRFEAAGNSVAAAAALREAIDLYHGELAEGEPIVEWLEEERRKYSDMHTAALSSLARYAHDAGDWQEADRVAAMALEADGCLESACRIRMSALARLGRRAEALRAFEGCARHLSEELGIQPSARTAAVAYQIRNAGTRS